MLDSDTNTSKPSRLISLDVFRGITIAGMLLVNNPGDWSQLYSPLAHADWHGWTPTDLIFPAFLFIMGVAMPFSLVRRIEASAGSPWRLMGSVLRRALILFGLGLSLAVLGKLTGDWPADWSSLRILGVLQRIGLCYFAVSLALMAGLRARGCIALSAVLLIGYHLLMKYMPVPGYGTGVLERAGNLATWLDDKILGSHGYKLDKSSGLWHDPEGLLSTVPAIATTLLGVITGFWLRRDSLGGYEKVAALGVAGTGLLVAGLLWGTSFPINKNLWSPSFVLVSAGWSLALLGACMWLVDLRGFRAWSKPFEVIGMNAIATFYGVALMGRALSLIPVTGAGGETVKLRGWIYENLYKSWITDLVGEKACSAAYGLTYIIVWMGIMTIFYRRRIFIKV